MPSTKEARAETKKQRKPAPENKIPDSPQRDLPRGRVLPVPVHTLRTDSSMVASGSSLSPLTSNRPRVQAMNSVRDSFSSG